MFSRNFRNRVYFFLISFFLLGLFLTTAISPVLSKLSAVNSINYNLPASQLVEEGREFYKKGNFQEAATAWQQAAQAYQQQGYPLYQAMVLSYLCLAYQQLEQWSEAQAAIQTSLGLLETEQTTSQSGEYRQISAQVLNIRGRLEMSLGQPDAALETWKLATKTYDTVGDRTGVTGSLINQAQALESLGLYRQTCKTLLEALHLDNQCDFSESEKLDTVLQTLSEQTSQIQVMGLRSLGNILRLMGNLDSSQQLLEQSLVTVQQIQSAQEESSTLLSLGKAHGAAYSKAKELHKITNLTSNKDEAKREADLNANKALEYYQQSTEISKNLSNYTINIQSKLQKLSLLVDYQQWLIQIKEKNRTTDIQKLESQIKSQVADLLTSKITNLPPSQIAVYAQLNFVQSLTQLKPQTEFVPIALKYAEDALQKAQSLPEKRTSSYALGILGKLYEENQQWSKAQEFTEQAVIVAQGIQAWDIAYQWQWQLGRLLKQQGKEQEAIAVYEAAVKTLEAVRGDLIATNSDLQFSFLENIEPIYRELVTLLLSAEKAQLSQDNLYKSLYYVESLQLAELENFLQCNLKEAGTGQINRVSNQSPITAVIKRLNQVIQDDPTAALIYPVILPEQITVVLKLPGQDLHYYTQPISQTELEATIDQLQTYLRDPSRTSDVKKLSSQVYDWLIKPFTQELETATDINSSDIKNLVFVLEGALRNIPMAVLYDKEQEQYLIERYAVAINSGLQLLDPAPLPRERNAVVAGVSKEREFAGQKFAPLENVPDELQTIQAAIPSTKLLDDEFTKTNLQNQINSGLPSVVHMATHGKFSSNPEETFIILWDKRLNTQDLDNLLRVNQANTNSNIELLVLSACETATGDKRAALGLAGVAVRAGANSTLATLWQVNDQSTAALMSQFYRQLQENSQITKAEALRLAQLKLWERKDKDWRRPFFWTSYVLVGNWL